MATKKNDEDVKAVAVVERFNDDTLRGIKSAEDAMRLITETYGGYVDITEELGSGFSLLEDRDKARLVGRPFIIVQVQFSQGTFGEFVSASLVTLDTNDRVIMNDGSTGICAQLRSLVDRLGRMGGFHVPKGLRESSYATCKRCGSPRLPSAEVCICGDDSTDRSQGTTYYLETSK